MKIPVSYTHLDVYKRQSQSSGLHTAGELKKMTVKEIRELAVRQGYEITKTAKKDIIEEYMMQQEEA